MVTVAVEQTQQVQLWVPIRVEGYSRFEYWVVATDAADPNLASSPSNIVVTNRASYLYSGEYLFADNPIYAASANYRLYPQADGNLVLSKYDTSTGRYSTVIWSVGHKIGSADRLHMQADGNLVYSAPPSSPWTTQTESTKLRDNSGAELDMALIDTDSRFDVRKGKAILWRSDTGRTY